MSLKASIAGTRFGLHSVAAGRVRKRNVQCRIEPSFPLPQRACFVSLVFPLRPWRTAEVCAWAVSITAVFIGPVSIAVVFIAVVFIGGASIVPALRLASVPPRLAPPPSERRWLHHTMAVRADTIHIRPATDTDALVKASRRGIRPCGPGAC
jgi:hypothetical protein